MCNRWPLPCAQLGGFAFIGEGIPVGLGAAFRSKYLRVRGLVPEASHGWRISHYSRNTNSTAALTLPQQQCNRIQAHATLHQVPERTRSQSVAGLSTGCPGRHREWRLGVSQLLWRRHRQQRCAHASCVQLAPAGRSRPLWELVLPLEQLPACTHLHKTAALAAAACRR